MSVFGDVCAAGSKDVFDLTSKFEAKRGVSLNLQTQTYGATISNPSPTMG